MSPPSGWSTHQLAEFLATVTAFPDERAATTGALERAAAAFDAEVAAVVREGSVDATIGFPAGQAPEAALVAAAGGQELPRIPGLGVCRAASVPLEDDRGGTLLLVRLGRDAFSAEEFNLLRAMARVLELALRMLRTVSQERDLRHQAEEQATERRRAERRLATQHAVARILAGSATAESSFVPLLRTLAGELECVSGAVWLAGEPSHSLSCAGVWRTSSGAGCEDPSSPPSHPYGEGLVRRVWAEGAPVWEPRAPPATDVVAGPALNVVLAFPIADGTEVVGVIELAGTELQPPDASALEMLLGVGGQVGQFLTRRRAEEQLAYQALHDALTGLPNRTLLLDRIAHASERAIRNATSIAVLFLDIDRFKDVNDSLGHDAGDQLLVAFAGRVVEIARASDTIANTGATVARLAGDEFVVLCEDLDSERDAVRLAERIAAEVAAPFEVDGNELKVSASIGIAVSGRPSPAAQLIRDADLAMYRAKEAGRDRYELFDAPMRTRVLERIELERDLRKALERDELQLHYQPLVSLCDGSIVGTEALLRWNHPGRGTVAPLEFVAIAEESGLIVPIGEWVLRTACRQLAEWLQVAACRDGFSMAVNLSPRQLTPGLPGIVADAVAVTGIDPASLCIEITESLLIEEAESPAALLCALKSAGLNLVLDDFGTGYSSLSYLHRFNLDSLKLDRSFIAELGRESSGSKLVAASIDMARALGLTVVAEGVETEQQLNILRELSCPLAQGYLFGRPAPAHELTARLRQRLPMFPAPELLLA
jgi:diguanylate cyclase (GGDEF)-like protein